MVVGVPNPKLRPTDDVVGVAIVPNVNGVDVVAVVPNDVLPKPKFVAGLKKRNTHLIIKQVSHITEHNFKSTFKLIFDICEHIFDNKIYALSDTLVLLIQTVFSFY